MNSKKTFFTPEAELVEIISSDLITNSGYPNYTEEYTDEDYELKPSWKRGS